jgi:protein TilB
MEGLTKLKELEYLNLAVNSVGKIEGVSRCESLNKLDLTLNFIEVEDLKESLENLEMCPHFTELYLTGNPCTDWPNYRTYTIAKVDTLMRLDGQEITKAQRLAAKTQLALLEKELVAVSAESIRVKEQKKKDGEYNENAYTRENRWQSYVDDQERKK